MIATLRHLVRDMAQPANEVAPLNLQKKPTLSMLINMPTQSGEKIRVIESIGAKYTSLGALLLDDDTGAKTEGIVASHPQQPAHHIIASWLQGGGREPVTWATLIDVLKEAGLKQLAQDIEKQAKPSQHVHIPPSPAENELSARVQPLALTTAVPGSAASPLPRGSQQSVGPSPNAGQVQEQQGRESERSSTGVKEKERSVPVRPFQKLPPPFDLNEYHNMHRSLKIPIAIYEKEPTSLIVYILSSREYEKEPTSLIVYILSSREYEKEYWGLVERRPVSTQPPEKMVSRPSSPKVSSDEAKKEIRALKKGFQERNINIRECLEKHKEVLVKNVADVLTQLSPDDDEQSSDDDTTIIPHSQGASAPETNAPSKDTATKQAPGRVGGEGHVPSPTPKQESSDTVGVSATDSSTDVTFSLTPAVSQPEMPSYYKFDRRYPGIRFFGTPWTQSVSSAGAHITSWWEEIGVEFDIPPGAVPKGRELELSVWPCSNGPFQLPDDHELASPVFLISPSFKFTREITLTMCHFSNLEAVDCKRMDFLSAPTPRVRETDKKPVYQFRVLQRGIFEPQKDYGRISLTHFCTVGIGRKQKEPSSPSDSPPRKRDENKYIYQVYQDKEFEDVAIFSAFLEHRLFFTALKERVKEYSPQLWSSSSHSISVEHDRIELQWPLDTGWEVTPDRTPCVLTMDMLDSHERDPYPQMIVLKIERDPKSSVNPTPVPVEILGITDRQKRFILKPKLRQSSLSSQFSLSSSSSGPFSPVVQSPQSSVTVTQSLEVFSHSSPPHHQEQSGTAGPSRGPARHSTSRPSLKDLLNNINTIKWYELGLQLTENEEELEVIESDYGGDVRTALRKTLQLSLREDPNLSWQKIVHALRGIHEFNTAKTIEDKFCRSSMS